jgi:hypothetical protein
MGLEHDRREELDPVGHELAVAGVAQLAAMVGMALVKSLYAIPTWTRVVALVREHAALQVALGCTPSVYACYRFTAKL